MSRICVPVCARSLDEMRDAVERAAEVADLIELRLDCLTTLRQLRERWRCKVGGQVVWTAADPYAAQR